MSDSVYLFQIEDADNLYCHFDGEGNDICGIKIYDEKGTHKYTITFVAPAYYKFPAKWKGAGFRLGTKEEHKALIGKVPQEVKARWQSKGFNFADRLYKRQSLFVVDIDTDTDNPIQAQIVARKPEIWIED